MHWCIKQKSRVVKPKSLREWDIYSMNSVYKMSIYMNVHKIQKRKMLSQQTKLNEQIKKPQKNSCVGQTGRQQ